MSMFQQEPRASARALCGLCVLTLLTVCERAVAQSGAPVDAVSTRGGSADGSSGVQHAKVTASGSGCPAGTWLTSLAEDGKSFITAFGGFDAYVAPGQTTAVEDCSMSIALNTPYVATYSLGKVYYTAFVNLTAGVSARLESQVYFGSTPGEAATSVVDVVGPQNRWLVMQASGNGWPVRTPCCTENSLHLRITVTLRSSDPLGTGHVRLHEFPSDSEPRMSLIWWGCDLPEDATLDRTAYDFRRQ